MTAGVTQRFRREIALSAIGLLATAMAFISGPAWGFLVLGAALLSMAALVLFVVGGAFLMPGTKAGYGDGKAAFALALVSIAAGLTLMLRAGELGARACRALPMLGCGAACTNGELVSVPSPARSVRAIRFVRSCDAPRGLTTHVSIVDVGLPLGDGPGNAFIVDGKADLVMLWIGGKQLAISGAGAATPRLQKNYLNGIRISYEDRPSGDAMR